MQVLLVCNAGGSAEALARKINRELAFHGVPATVDACGVGSGLRKADVYDAILLSPQVAYAKRDFQKRVAPGALVRVLTQVDYGRTNAKKIANDVLEALGE